MDFVCDFQSDYITARRLFVYPAYKWFSDVYEKCSDHKNDTMVTEYLNNFLKFSIKSSLDYNEKNIVIFGTIYSGMQYC